MLAAGCKWPDAVKLWRVRDGALLRTFSGQASDGVYSVAFAPDGKTLACGRGDGTIKLWRVCDGVCLRTLVSKTTRVLSVAFAPDGQTLAGSDNCSVDLWRVRDGARLCTLPGKIQVVLCMAFTPDGRTLAVGGFDNVIKLWDVNPDDTSYGACLHTLTGHRDCVPALSFTPDGQTPVSGSWDKTIRLWQVKHGVCLNTFNVYKGVYYMSLAPDGQSLVCGIFRATLPSGG